MGLELNFKVSQQQQQSVCLVFGLLIFYAHSVLITRLCVGVKCVQSMVT